MAVINWLQVSLTPVPRLLNRETHSRLRRERERVKQYVPKKSMCHILCDICHCLQSHRCVCSEYSTHCTATKKSVSSYVETSIYILLKNMLAYSNNFTIVKYILIFLHPDRKYNRISHFNIWNSYCEYSILFLKKSTECISCKNLSVFLIRKKLYRL